jgi:redox-sensitive bicupin YhaK (pirin superfamily)
MSTVESRPDVVACGPAAPSREPAILRPRAVPLGGPRAMTVRRTLPQRSRSLIGAWCFVDHYGPDDVRATGGMEVPGHPHTCLQTVTWLFAGSVEHCDTVGTLGIVRPGEVNLMTAGRGIAHSEFSTPDTSVLHGIQLWVALPESARLAEPGFEHHAPVPSDVGGARLTVFIGSLMGASSPVRTMTPLLGAEIVLTRTEPLTLEVDPGFEHGVLVDTGDVSVAGVDAAASDLVYLPAGSSTLTLTAAHAPARLLLLGGTPFDERLVMWWNFIGRSHDEIAEFREQWQRQVDRHRETRPGDTPFGPFPREWTDVLPAPPLPNARLRPRP